RLERVVEVLPAVVDPRETWAGEELVAEQLLPQLLDRLQLGEEAVASQVEAVALELNGLSDAAHHAVGLEDGAPDSTLAQNVGGRQPGGPGSQDGGSGVFEALPQACKCTPGPGRDPQLRYVCLTSAKSPSWATPPPRRSRARRHSRSSSVWSWPAAMTMPPLRKIAYARSSTAARESWSIASWTSSSRRMSGET